LAYLSHSMQVLQNYSLFQLRTLFFFRAYLGKLQTQLWTNRSQLIFWAQFRLRLRMLIRFLSWNQRNLYLQTLEHVQLTHEWCQVQECTQGLSGVLYTELNGILWMRVHSKILFMLISLPQVLTSTLFDFADMMKLILVEVWCSHWSLQYFSPSH